MDLRDWMQFMTEQVRAPFPQEQLEAIDRCVGPHETSGAMLLSFIGACAHQGWTTDEIGFAVTVCMLEEEVGPDGKVPSVTPELIDDVVTPVVQEFSWSGAPWSRPWDATGLHTLLVWALAGVAIEKLSWDSVESELLYWTVGGALNVPLPDAPLDRAEPAELRRSLQALTVEESASARQRREKDRRRCIDSWPAELRIRDDLLELFALRHSIEWTQAQEGSLAAGVHDELERLLDATAARELAYPSLERELLRGQHPDVLFRRECLSAMHERWRFLGRFPDQVKGDEQLAATTHNFVGGSRSTYSSSTIARTCWVYLLRTQRQVDAFADLPDWMPLDVRVQRDRILIHPFDLDDPSMLEPLTCERTSARNIWPLLIYLDGGWATIRVVEFAGDDFRLRDPRGMNISGDQVATIGEPLMASLRELTGGDASALPRLVRSEHEVDEDTLDRVVASEMARGAFLVSEFDLRFGTDGEIPEDTVVEYKQARRRLLRLRAIEAARAYDDTASISPEDVRSAQSEMTDLHEWMRVLRAAPLASFARVLADPERVLVLLRIDGGVVHADWACVHPGAELTSYADPACCAEALITGTVDLGQVQPVADGANAWFESKAPAALDQVLGAVGDEIMGPLHFELASKRDLLLSPTWFLGLLPLHAAPLIGAGRVVDRFDVTYVPGAALLDRLTGLGPVRVSDCLSATSTQSVPRAAEELKILEILFGTSSVDDLTPEMALHSPAASIVHLAAHGYARLGGWSSGIALSGESGYLSLARLLEEGDYSSTGVANIAACESGLELTYELVPNEYLSIDNAMLACGARAVVSNLWELSGPVSVLFSACFYTAVAEGEQVGDAYRAAASSVRALGETEPPPRVRKLLDRVDAGWCEHLQQQELRARVPISHPYFWAGFKCSGWSWGALEATTKH
ncbi:MAG TPA: CHAT domain-containing protein [Solirubrobacteraceae bacterium]|jgi:hypothetical protein|nr:CHAT domain-containing protein [Solirubrobacteraceae bacterium]